MAKSLPGKGSGITVQGIALCFARWEVTGRADDLDTTCFEDVGVETGIIGVVGCDLTASGNWDATRNPMDNPPGIYPRDDLPSVQCYEARALPAILPWSFPKFRVLSARNSAEARGLVAFEFSGKANGFFSQPIGSAV